MAVGLIGQKTQRSEWLWFAVMWVVMAAIVVPWSWNHISLLEDPGWFLQVARRVADGEVLYRDVLWAYGPLPVFVQSGLVRLLGGFDATCFSLLAIGSCLIASSVIYKLQRYFLSPLQSFLATWVVMVGGGIYVVFIRSYTPSQPMGTVFLLLVLLGIVGTLEGMNRCLSSAWIACGVFGCWLTKPEYAFGSLVLCLVTLAILYWAKLSDDLALHRRPIAFGLGLGLATAVLTYLGIGLYSGWLPMFLGVSGYDQTKVLGLALIGYAGPSSCLSMLVTALLVIILGWIAHLCDTQERRRIRYSLIALAGLCVFVCLAGWLAWQSGWLEEVFSGQRSYADWLSLISLIRSSFSNMVIYAASDLYHVTLACLVLLMILLLFKWSHRIRRQEMANTNQVVCFVGTLFGILIALRQIPFGGTPLFLTSTLTLGLALSSEFPHLDFARPWRADARVILLLVLFLSFVAGTLFQAYVFLLEPYVAFTSPHGDIVLPKATQPFVSEVVSYISSSTSVNDYMVVVGALPGLYFLSGRRNPLAEDYYWPGIGDTEADGQDFLRRVDEFQPALLIVPQGSNNPGLLEVSGTARTRVFGAWRLFGQSASQVEQSILSKYRMDRLIASPSYSVAVFKRLP